MSTNARVIFQTESYRIVQRDTDRWPKPFYFDVETLRRDALGAEAWGHLFAVCGISSSSGKTAHELVLGEIFTKLASEKASSHE